MGGNRAAYAPLPPAAGRHREGNDNGAHAVRKGQPTRLDDSHEPFDSDDEETHGVKQRGYTTRANGYQGLHDSDEYDDDEEYEDEQAAAKQEQEQETRRERQEMQTRFTFHDRTPPRNLKHDIVRAMQRKRRLLLRNENLRFREIYKPPEPGVVVTVIAMVTIVALILTKSWPFY